MTPRRFLRAKAHLLLLFALGLSAQGAELRLDMFPMCVSKFIHQIYPDLAERGNRVNNQVFRFIRAIKPDMPVPGVRKWSASSNRAIHYDKHRMEFARLGISFRNEQEYSEAAYEFARSSEAKEHRILFQGEYDGTVYKVDLDDGRALIMDPNGMIITFYVMKPQTFGFKSIAEQAFEKMYRGVGRTGSTRMPVLRPESQPRLRRQEGSSEP